MADNRLSQKINVTRFGETLPLKLDRASIIKMAQAAAVGEQLGMPAIGKSELFNKIALEGRADAGANEYNYNNAKAKVIYDAMKDMGFSGSAAIYPAAVFDKNQVAKRLGIPFEKAWNGTGRVISDGTYSLSNSVLPRGVVMADSERHYKRSEAMKGAKDDPRNKEVTDLISRAMSGDLTGQEQLLVMPDKVLANAITGGRGKVGVAEMSVQASKAMRSTPAGKKLYDEIGSSYMNDLYYTLPEDLAQLYKIKAGVDIPLELELKGTYSNPALDVMLGIDPGAEKFLAEAEKKYPAPPSILDKILSFFN